MVSIRLAIVASALALLLAGIDPVGRHPLAASVVVGVAIGYALVLLRRVDWERQGSRSSLVVTTADSVLALAFVATTGGGQSPAATILFLVIIAAATRLRLPVTVLLSLTLGACYLAIVLLVEPAPAPLDQRLQSGLWLALYLLLTGVFSASIALYVERAHAARAAARAEAIAEHSAATEERDLRARLLATYQAQHDGLRAILHDFRTPVSSLRALSGELADPATRIGPDEREAALRLVAAHSRQLSSMLDALADVAASRDPNRPAAAPQPVVLRELLLAAADAAGLRPPRLRLAVTPAEAVVLVDEQRLRRVLINLLDNAARHGRGDPVDLVATVNGGWMTVDILDRGPGMSPEDLRVATRKDVSLGEAAGGSGLGLWIVGQIVQAMRGELRLAVRDGGGLSARVSLPVS
ncbi:MAG: sensor histidine kinase [Actinophytocola sp.]|nr:sensor histidine kinase [Actinophytocola sp.]